MQTINPDLYTVSVSANPETILMGGDTSVITVQLYYNGAASSTSGITVHFESSNPSAGSFASSTVATNSNGAASQTLTSGSAGTTNVRTYVDFGNGVTKEDTVQVTVLSWGKITGVIRDKNGAAVPNAKVSLLTGGQLYRSFENPQLSSSIEAGKYNFYRIPYGQYTVMAEKTDAAGANRQASASVNLNAATATLDITITDLVTSAPLTPAATPTLSPAPTATPTTTQTTSPTVVPGPVSSDNIAPVTSVNLTGVTVASGDFTSNVICTLSAQDNPGGSGISVIQYSFDGSTWNNYTSPFTVTKPGVTTIFYKSVDLNGNAEVAQVKSITIAGSPASPTQKTPAPTIAVTIVSLVIVSMLLVLVKKTNKK